MAWKKWNNEENKWEDNPEADKLWEKYMSVVDTVYRTDDWNNANNDQREKYSGKVVKKLVQSWEESDISRLMDLLYEARNLREYDMLRSIGY